MATPKGWPPLLTRVSRALRRALGPPPRRCPQCGTMVLPDDEQVKFEHRVYHAECLSRMMGLD